MQARHIDYDRCGEYAIDDCASAMMMMPAQQRLRRVLATVSAEGYIGTRRPLAPILPTLRSSTADTYSNCSQQRVTKPAPTL